ncbi:predicted methyltransferase [Ectocarpus siliculosus]|uniref:Predicted methyltransferase n=1 Tax=Ectocarpus siliculosus TaxID=2880 RepID=D8LS47_ECTSI|nr:predicted methyltransferase [Ectocarpus siliculosus]|eukprot:CBN75104.1 predicted methyltransferase [Ectocarpus siliculosus]
MAFPAPNTGGRRCSNTALAFTRQQMIDMGLVPPEGAEQEAQNLLLSRPYSTEEEEEEEEEEGAGGHPAAMADDAEEPAEAVGLIGHFEASRLLAQKGKEGTFVGSLDMSMTERELVSTEEGVALPPSPAAADGDGDAESNLVASWDELAVVLKKAKKGQYGCWELYADGNTPCKVSDISESTSRPAMLCAPLRSAGAPTMVLGGFAMHRISGGDQKSTMEPGLDTEHKVSASGARRTNGRVLDTCTGLGYTAIAAARCRGVSGVVTVELDEVSLRMCRRNPWSQEMFRNEKITSLLGDCCELVKDFDDGEFAAIIHDPPARALCKTTDMYGAAFYKDLARVLKPGGTLFHYIGNPESNEGGRLFRGVIDRLIGAGFHDCKTDKKAFGVVARR